MNLFLVTFNPVKAPLFMKESRRNGILFVEHRDYVSKALIYQAPVAVKSLFKKRVFISSKLIRSARDLYADVEFLKSKSLEPVLPDVYKSFTSKLFQNGIILQKTFFDSAVIYEGNLFTPVSQMGRFIGVDGWKADLLRKELSITAVRKCVMLEDGESEFSLFKEINPNLVSVVIWNKKTGRKFIIPVPEHALEDRPFKAQSLSRKSLFGKQNYKLEVIQNA